MLSETTLKTNDVALNAIEDASDLILGYLKQIGVEYVFGVPGGAIEPLYNALAREERCDGIQSIVARHETGAAFMADGYASLTGKLGVCCTTTGPGATNLITGVASAYENKIPMLAITAQTSLKNFGKRALQESSCTGVNTVGMFEFCTRYNSLVSDVSQLERKLIAAITTAFRYPQGPVHLSIPMDILRAPVKNNYLKYKINSLLDLPRLLDKGKVKQLHSRLKDAKKIVFVLGRRCVDAVDLILMLATHLDADVVTTLGGKGFVSPYHSQYRGVFGAAGHKSAHSSLMSPSVDLVVLVGSNIGEWASNGGDHKALLNHRLVHVDSDVENFSRSPMAALHVGGDIELVFEHILKDGFEIESQRLTEKNLNSPSVQANAVSRSLKKLFPFIETLPEQPEREFELDGENKYLDDSIPIKPQRLMRELARQFPLNTLFLADSGNSMLWAAHYLHPLDRRMGSSRAPRCGVVRSSPEFASMGWGIGAAVGTALGDRNLPVVCITGDGSMLMSGQELTVAIAEELTVIFVVLNDSTLGMVKHGQALGGAERIGAELPVIDFATMAKSMGAQAYKIYSPQDMLDLDIDAICSTAGPTLLDVYIDPDEAPPMGARVKVLGGD